MRFEAFFNRYELGERSTFPVVMMEIWGGF